MSNKTNITLIALIIIEILCIIGLRNEPFAYILIAVTLLLGVLTAYQIRRG